MALVSIQRTAGVLSLILLHTARSFALELVGGARAEGWLLVNVVGGFRNAQVIVLRRLPSLIERVLPSLHVLSWLGLFISLEAGADGTTRACNDLLSTRLENAWEFDAFSLLAHIHAACSLLQSNQKLLSDRWFSRGEKTL